MSSAVVLLSGGIDSSVCLALAAEAHDIVQPVHIHYGQQTQDVEAFRASCQRDHMVTVYEYTDILSLEVIDCQGVFSHFSGGVAEDGKDFSHLTEDDGRSSGYVPMRNLLFISMAAARADFKDHDYVYHGAQGGDEADYPDCRPKFLKAAQKAVHHSLPEGESVILKTPLIDKTKTEVVELADEKNVDFKFTYSCYSDTSVMDPDPCGECPACLERTEAFEKAGIEDPFDVSGNPFEVSENE